MSTFTRIQEIIGEQLGVSSAAVPMTASLEKDLGIDSLEKANLMLEVEDAFGIDGLKDEVKSILTVRDLVDCVDRGVYKRFCPRP